MHTTKKSLWATVMIFGGVLGMTAALTLSGYVQVLVERAQMGATWAGYFDSQASVWFAQGMDWRLIMGVVTLLGFIVLIADLLSIGKAAHHDR